MSTTPPPPYYAVIFSSQSIEHDTVYDELAQRMAHLAAVQPGFLGMESTKGPDGFGITVSYWTGPDAIAAWRRHVDHLDAQQRGRKHWYERYAVRVAKVERAYEWLSNAPAP